MRIMLHDARPVNPGSFRMKLTHHPPQIVASKPNEGFWFQPVQAERSREKAPQEELPARQVDRHSTVNSRQRGQI